MKKKLVKPVKKSVKKRIGALFMAVSLVATEMISNVETVLATQNNQSDISMVSTYEPENTAQETSQQEVESPDLQENQQEIFETQAEEKTAQETQGESITQQLTTEWSGESEYQPTIEQSDESEYPSTNVGLDERGDELSSEMVSFSENSSEDNSYEEDTSYGEEACSQEESFEEESFEEESSEEASTEQWDEYSIELWNLGDVSQIVKIDSCRIENGQVTVKGTINQKFTSKEDVLYLFEEPMYQKDIDSNDEPIAKIDKTDQFVFSVPLNDNTAQSRLYSKFFVGVKFSDGTYHALSDGSFLTNPEALASNQSAYPQARSKKGLLTEATFGTDIDELGLSYTNVNIVMNLLLGGGGCSYTYNGKTYQYSSSYIASLDQTLSMYQKNNIIVNAVLLWVPDGNAHGFGFPGASTSVGAYHGWNVVSEEGIECVSAALHFLGERYGRSDNAYGHIACWTVGNEVNADTSWNYTGHQSADEYAYIYSNMLRITSQAVRSSCAHARVFMSLDMFWNGVSGASRYDGKEIVNYVNTYMKAEGDIPWGVAFHPYANPLTEVEWWNDNATFDENAVFISMENISVLTNYLCKGELRNPDGSVKHVILSEQGFTSHSANQGNVEWKQAAAYAYAYYVAEANPYIDAFIAMREIDAKPEADAGIHQGLWYNDENKSLCTFAKKPAWTVWKYIDTDQSFAYTDSLAPLVGLSSFSSVYGSVMAERKRSVALGESAYATSYDVGNSLMNGWYGEYGLTSCNADGSQVRVTAGANSPYTYAGIARTGTVDFSAQRYFCFTVSGTAGATQNLRARMRFTSGQDVLETEVSFEKNKSQMIYADLGNWKGKACVSKIQIWIQQDGTQNWENGSFVVTNICQSSAVRAGKASVIEITDSGYSDVSASGFSVYCKVSGSNTASHVEYSAWNIAASTQTAVTKQATVANGYSSCNFSISEFGGRTGAYAVRMTAYDKNNIASEPVVVSVTVKGAADALVISNAYITDISYDGFTITVEAASDYGLSDSSQVAVWSSSAGQKKSLIWYPLQFSNGKASVHVNISDHGGWSGEYYCHSYVQDRAGARKLYACTASVPSPDPQITAATTSQVSAIGYHIQADFKCPRGISYAQVKTWSEKNGEASAVTTAMVVTGTKGSVYISTADHNGQSGTYHSVISLYDKAGQCGTRKIDVFVPEDLNKWERKPQITASCTSMTQDSYRISFSFTSYLGCRLAHIASWTEENGQDDLVWRDLTFDAATNSGYIDLPVNDKKGGPYINDLYVWDQAGQVSGYRVVVQAPSKMPKIVNITVSDVSNAGYRVTVMFDAYMGVSHVLMPTWTKNNGQDDLVWYQAVVSGNTASYYVRTSEHNNETGTYVTHVYVYDRQGDVALEGIDVIIDSSSNSGYTGLFYQDGIWKYYENGTFASTYHNLTYYNQTWYYVRNGVVDWNYTGLYQYNGTWYYINKGALDWGYTGLCQYQGKWFYVRSGALDWNYTGLCRYNGTWYYVQKGALNWKYTGLCLYYGTWYYVQSGVLNWNYTGLCLYQKTWYMIRSGVLDWNYTELVFHKASNSWYYVRNGMIDWNYTGVVLYYGRYYYIQKGWLNWQYNGECVSQGKTYIVTWGVAQQKETIQKQ